MEGQARLVYLIAVLMVLEACVVVHETVQFLKTLVLLLCLGNNDKTLVRGNKFLSKLFSLKKENVGTRRALPQEKSVLVIGSNACESLEWNFSFFPPILMNLGRLFCEKPAFQEPRKP